MYDIGVVSDAGNKEERVLGTAIIHTPKAE
jgi:hypothetical protein